MGVFTYREARLSVAHHEAGHAVVAMLAGLHVVSSEIQTGGDVTTAADWHVGGITYIVMLPRRPIAWGKQAAAGELAALKWHQEVGIVSPEHLEAVDAEHDFRESVDLLSEHGFDLESVWPKLRSDAQRTIDALWPEITAVATALDQAGRLAGDDIARIAGLINASRLDTAA